MVNLFFIFLFQAVKAGIAKDWKPRYAATLKKFQDQGVQDRDKLLNEFVSVTHVYSSLNSSHAMHIHIASV